VTQNEITITMKSDHWEDVLNSIDDFLYYNSGGKGSTWYSHLLHAQEEIKRKLLEGAQ
jgi:hypothetical protein